MSFLIYDLTLLVLFALFVAFFLYRNRKNLKKEGLLFLYKTSWGIRLINSVGKKYKKTLSFLSYVSIALGYFLMASMVYLLGKIAWIYIFNPAVVRAIKVPPITPLIPYLPQVFKIDFLPPFYFSYWIIILAIVAIFHEFAHGIFAAHNKIKIKTTGFGFFPFFLPIFLAAFVELDEDKMAKEKKFSQLVILSAGTFANVLTAIVAFGILWLFFSFAFVPSGVVFDSYTYSLVSVAGITMINGVSLENSSYSQIMSLVENDTNQIRVGDKNFLATRDLLEQQGENNFLILYDDSPAINANLPNIITSIDGVKINSYEKLGAELGAHTPGEEIKISVIDKNGELQTIQLTLAENPEDETKAYLGIGFSDTRRSGVVGVIVNALSSFKDPHVYYTSSDLSIFIYNLLWWLVLICASVALVNMLPVGIFDGGRFFYLTILGLTGREKIAKKSFTFITYLFLLLLLALMFFWAKSFF